MALTVNTNIAAMNAYRNLSVTDGQMNKSLEKLSSGFRINRAADDAAGLAISEGMRAQIGGLKMAVRNAQDGISVVQTAEGALTETHSILQRMRDLSVQASNDGGLNAEAKKNIQAEVGQLKSELDRIAGTTRFNGQQLLDGSYAGTFQIGANAGETIKVAIGSVGKGMDTIGLGVNGVDVTAVGTTTATILGAVSDDQGTPAAGTATFAGDFTTATTFAAAFTGIKGTLSYNGKSFDTTTVDYAAATQTAAGYLSALNTAASAALGGGAFTASATNLVFTGAVPATGSTAADAAALSPSWKAQSGATAAIALIDTAITRVSTQRANLGAVQNRFEHTINNLNVAVENVTASESRIRDTDMAMEMSTFTKSQILSQAGTAMLAQANQAPQGILKLLQ